MENGQQKGYASNILNNITEIDETT